MLVHEGVGKGYPESYRVWAVVFGRRVELEKIRVGDGDSHQMESYFDLGSGDGEVILCTFG